MENRGPRWKSLWNLACGLVVLPWFLNGSAKWLIKELAGEGRDHGHLITYQDWNKRPWATVVNSKAHVSQQNSWNTLGTNDRVWRGTCQWSYLQISLVCCSVKAEQWTLHCISCQRLHRQKREAINDEIYIIWLKIPIMTCYGSYSGAPVHQGTLEGHSQGFCHPGRILQNRSSFRNVFCSPWEENTSALDHNRSPACLC